ncbi:hypothetical protein BASA81_002163 [Batrachochytrium salamandrivorans]|nr:hypothetical protein BASA81_002163 [Batrachochytrium salamandrivorans]
MGDCYRDLVFQVSANVSLEPCAEPYASVVVTVLFSLTAVVLSVLLIQGLLGAYVTTNPKARSTLLWFVIPSALGLANSILIATGATETGEDGYTIIIVFGLCTVAILFFVQKIGMASLDALAEASLKAVDSKTRAKFTPRPLLGKFLSVLRLSSYAWYVLVFVCLCIMFPLANVGGEDYGHSYATRIGTKQFWWDLGIMTAQFLGATSILLFSEISMYIAVKNLQTCLSNISGLAGVDSSDHMQKYVKDLEELISRARLAMLAMIPAGLVSWILGFCITYISGIGPKYYLMWIYTTQSLVFLQAYMNAFFCPDHMLARLRGTYSEASSSLAVIGQEGSKLELKSSKQQMVSKEEAVLTATQPSSRDDPRVADLN